MLAISVLILLGATIGWLFAIVTRIEGGASLVKNLLAGVVGSLASAALVAGGTACMKMTALILIIALAGAGIAVSVLYAIRRSFPLPVVRTR